MPVCQAAKHKLKMSISLFIGDRYLFTCANELIFDDLADRAIMSSAHVKCYSMPDFYSLYSSVLWKHISIYLFIFSTFPH